MTGRVSGGVESDDIAPPDFAGHHKVISTLPFFTALANFLFNSSLSFWSFSKGPGVVFSAISIPSFESDDRCHGRPPEPTLEATN